MDDRHFDNLTRALASRQSRRRLVAGALAAAAGTLLGRAEDSEAAPCTRSCPDGQHLETKRCRCVCDSTDRVPNNAGVCPCARGSTRCDGQCRSCPKGQNLDTGSCQCLCHDGRIGCGSTCCERTACLAAVCDDGNCALITDASAVGSPCDDKGMDNAVCRADGSCGTPPLDCSGLDTLCSLGVYNLATEQCETESRPIGAACASPETPCQIGACNAAGDCENAGPATDSTPCGTEGGQCCENQCLNVATCPQCYGHEDCFPWAQDNGCQSAECRSGRCVVSNILEGFPCPPEACNGSSTCFDGICRGNPIDCSRLTDACNVGVCNPDTGNCVKQPRNPSSPCTGLCCPDGTCATGSETCCGNTACANCCEDTCLDFTSQSCCDLGPCPGACCPDGSCSDPANGVVCCGTSNCLGECCANGECAISTEGEICCGDNPCFSGRCLSNGVCLDDCTCDGKQCGSDGCGGSCGNCPSGLTCSASGQCECTPTSCPDGCCSDRACHAGIQNDHCGTDGQACVSCPSNETCTAERICQVVGCLAGYNCIGECCDNGECAISYEGQVCCAGAPCYDCRGSFCGDIT